MLTDLIARAIAGQLKCSPECVDYPEGCGCAQNATAAVEKALADAGLVVAPKEPTEAMICHGDEAIIEALKEIPTTAEPTPAQRCYRAMIAAR